MVGGDRRGPPGDGGGAGVGGGVRGIGAVLEGLHLRFADAAYRVAVADLDRRQSFESRAVKTLEPTARREVGTVEVASAATPAVAEVEMASPAEKADVAGEGSGHGGSSEAEPATAGDGAGVEISAASSALVDAPRASSEMMEPSTQERAQEPTDAALEIDTPRAPVHATEEPLPMATQFRKLEQPDVPVRPVAAAETVLIPEAPVEPSEARSTATAPMPQSGHRRVPVRRVQPEPEPAKNWLQRIFQRDAEPVVSIIPDGDDDEDEIEGVSESKTELPAVSVARPAFAEQDFDLPLRAEPVAEAEEIVPSQGGVGQAAEPEMAIQLPVAAEAVQAEEAESAVAIEEQGTQAPPAWARDLVEVSEDVPVAAATEVLEVEAGPVAEPESVAPVAEPAGAPVQSETTASEEVQVEFAEPVVFAPALEADAEPVAQAAAAVTSVETAETEIGWERPVAARTEVMAQPEPFRTGRWEPARQTSRPEAAPWRDRRVSGPNAVYRSPERRFNWNTETAKPLALVPNPAQEAAKPAPPKPAPRLAERAPVPASAAPGRLTRQWGLLSRFENPEGAGEATREQDRHGEQASGNRGYRRG